MKKTLTILSLIFFTSFVNFSVGLGNYWTADDMNGNSHILKSCE